jgi:hypothetical protein
MVVTLLALASGVWAQTATTKPAATQPTASAQTPATLGELQFRANQDMARGDYAGALPLLRSASQQLMDKPDQLGPLLEQIRVCQRQIANAARNNTLTSVTGANITAIAAATPVAVEPRKPHVLPKPGETLDLPIKDLGNFDYDSDKGGNIPDDVKRLEGVKFRTSGYMVPLDQAERISNFALVPSLFSCCFGQPPQIQHTLVVQTAKGIALAYFPDELVVEGTLHVKEQKDGGFIVSIFQMDATSVRPAAK